MATYTRPNLLYYWCRACNLPHGFYFSRRTPADPFDDPASCPNCGAKEGEISKTPEGQEMRWPSGNPLYLVRRMDGHREVAEWRRQKAVQDRELPYKAPVGQYVQVSMRFIDQVSMKLSHLDLHVLLVLLRFTNNTGHQFQGWTAPLSQSTIGTYVMPPGRQSPVRRETINESLKRLHETRVQVWNQASQEFEDKALVEIISSHPKRFKVNMP